MELYDKVLLITGASSGIGKATALALAKKGNVIILVARNKEHLADAVKEVQEESPSSYGVACDVSDHKNVAAMIHGVQKQSGKIDGVINAAGIGLYKPVMETTVDEFTHLINVNYLGTVHVIKEILPDMLERKEGCIVNIASVAGKTGFPHISAYAASKFAVVGFTESLYYDVRKEGIHVHLICPGAVNTDFFNHESFSSFPHEQRHKNMIQPEDVAHAILNAIEKDEFEVFVPASARLKYIGKNILRKTYMNRVMNLPR